MKNSEVSKNLGKKFPNGYANIRIEKITKIIKDNSKGTAYMEKSNPGMVSREVEISLPRIKWLERPYAG
jgi:hypothetical protein